jgi:hypothetical protein
MTQARNSLPDGFVGAILLWQYNDLMRRRSGGFEAERRLLWAVLENAINTYLTNMRCATAKQHNEFEEISDWFRPSRDQSGMLFSFETICDLLEIDVRRLLRRLESIRERETRTNMGSWQTPRAALRLGRFAA